MKTSEQLSLEIAKAIKSRITTKGYDNDLLISIYHDPSDDDTSDPLKLDSFEGTMCLLEMINGILRSGLDYKNDSHESH